MSADQELLVQTAERLLDSRPADMARAAADLGWPMLVFDEADGGLRTDPRDLELLALFETFGRHVQSPQILFQLVLGGTILAAGLSPADRARRLPAIMAGGQSIAAALLEPEQPSSWRPAATVARPTPDGWRVSGRKTLAIGADTADLVLASAVLEVDGDRRTAVFEIDRALLAAPTRGYVLRDGQIAADLDLDGLDLPSAALLLDGEAADVALTAALQRTKACLVAEATGLIAHLVARTQDYTAQRAQFGQPIGQFQVIQHRLADMATMLAQADAIVARLRDGDAPTDALELVAELALSAAMSAVQLHGGMGMTEELPLGRALRRAMTLLLMF